jgi:isoaspartyl peptidase/L-asparaginase-like protein (Ntn-hydrolase superfamily)
MHDQVLRMHDAMARATGFPTMEDYVVEGERKRLAQAEADQKKAAALEEKKLTAASKKHGGDQRTDDSYDERRPGTVDRTEPGDQQGKDNE